MTDEGDQLRIYRNDEMNERDRRQQEIEEEREERIQRALSSRRLESKIIEIKNNINQGFYNADPQKLYERVFDIDKWGFFGDSLKNKEEYYNNPELLDDFIAEQVAIQAEQDKELDKELEIRRDNIITLNENTDRAWREENKNFIKMFEEATNDNQKIILDNIELKDIIAKNIRRFNNDPESFVSEQQAIINDRQIISDNIKFLKENTEQEWRSNNKYFETDFLNGTIDYQNFILENLHLKDEISAYITENKNKYFKPRIKKYNDGLLKIVDDYRNKETKRLRLQDEREAEEDRERQRLQAEEERKRQERERQVKEQRKQQARKTIKPTITISGEQKPQQGIKPQQLRHGFLPPDIASEVFFKKYPEDLWTSGDSGKRGELLLELMNEEMFHQSNINEKATKNKFKQRVVGLEGRQRTRGDYGPIWDKPNRLPNTKLICPDEYTYYEYAELKSSLLVKLIVEKHNKDLGKFMYENVRKCFYFVCPLTINIDLFLSEYRNLFFNDNSEFRYANSNHHDYPVLDPIDLIFDPTKIKEDFYAAYNLTKFMWKILAQGEHSLRKNELVNFENFSPNLRHLELATTFIQMIQQSYFAYVDTHKHQERIGIERHNTPRPDWRQAPGLFTELEFSNENKQVGITNLQHERLETTNTPWNHPGRSGCRISYKGSYGSKRYEAANRIGDKQNLYASVQCGISGSINFPLTIFLISCLSNYHIINDNNKPPFNNNSTEVKKLILSGISGLVSDGGHNVAEVITGFTIVSIGLKKLRDTLIDECDWIAGSVGKPAIYDYVNQRTEEALKTQNIILAKHYVQYLIPVSKKSFPIGINYTDKDIFYFVVDSLIHLSPVIDEFYNQMKHINPMGMYSDTEIYPSYTLSEAINDLVSVGYYQQFEHLIHVNALKAMIYRDKETMGKNSCIMVTALDNYTERNNYDFYSGPKDFVIKLLGDLKYTDVITDVDILMEARLKECDQGGFLPFDNNDIPYAGGKKKQSRQRKKKQSITRKKKQSITRKKK